MKDLVVLVADGQAKAAMVSVLARHESLGIRPLSFDVFPHPNKDPGVLRASQEFLRPLLREYSYTIVLFDFQGCGQEKYKPGQLEIDVLDRLVTNGWRDRAHVIVLDPELEAWVWSRSPVIASLLGWSSYRHLRNWLIGQGFEDPGTIKPKDPKGAMEAALEKSRLPRSASIFQQIASKVDFSACEDASFRSLVRVLREWFPREAGQ